MSECNYVVYALLDHNDKEFYIGITKNLEVRIREHYTQALHTNKRTKKAAKILETVRKAGKLHCRVLETGLSIDEACRIESALILRNRHLTNIRPGGEVQRTVTKRSKPKQYTRSTKCPYCEFKFKRISKHTCPYKEAPLGTKMCNVCKEFVTLDNFSRHVHTFDCLQALCKQCASQVSKS